MAEQLVALTSLRGIAALLVAVYHLSGTCLPDLNLGARSAFLGKAYLCVDLFFVLSGFVLMHVYGGRFRERVAWRGIRAFLAARVARIYPLYGLVLVAFLALELLRLALAHAGLVHFDAPPLTAADSRSPGALLVDLLMLQPVGIVDRLSWNYPAWSVGAEWYAYLLFPALAAIVDRLGWWLRAAAVAAGMVGLWSLSSGPHGLDVTYDGGLVRCVLEFLGGVMLYRLYESPAGARWLGHDLSLALLAAAIVAAMQARLPDAVLPPLFALLIVGAVLGRGRIAGALAVRPLQFLGEISYAVYLSHFLVLAMVELAWRVATGAPFGRGFGIAGSLAALAGLVALVVAASAPLHRHVERPAREVLRRGLAPAPLPAAAPAAGGEGLRPGIEYRS